MTRRPCIVCGTPTDGSRCRKHKLAGATGYDTQHWKTISALRLDYDDHLCQLRYDGCTLIATTVHLDPACGGDHSLATLDLTLSACRHCHGVEDGPRASGNTARSAA